MRDKGFYLFAAGLGMFSAGFVWMCVYLFITKALPLLSLLNSTDWSLALTIFAGACLGLAQAIKEQPLK